MRAVTNVTTIKKKKQKKTPFTNLSKNANLPPSFQVRPLEELTVHVEQDDVTIVETDTNDAFAVSLEGGGKK